MHALQLLFYEWLVVVGALLAADWLLEHFTDR